MDGAQFSQWQLKNRVLTYRDFFGRYDMVCPMATAWELHKALPEADFRVVQTAGHAGSELTNSKELVVATNRFKNA